MHKKRSPDLQCPVSSLAQVTTLRTSTFFSHTSFVFYVLCAEERAPIVGGRGEEFYLLTIIIVTILSLKSHIRMIHFHLFHFHLCNLLQTDASHFTTNSACGFVKLMTLQNVKLCPQCPLCLSYKAQTRPDVSMSMKFTPTDKFWKGTMQKRDEDNFDGHPAAYDTKLALK